MLVGWSVGFFGRYRFSWRFQMTAAAQSLATDIAMLIFFSKNGKSFH